MHPRNRRPAPSATRSARSEPHLTGALRRCHPLDLLASKQDRIAHRLALLDAQIEAGAIEYEQAKAHLDDCLALAGDCHAIYMSIDDSLRRIANQALFDKLIVTPDESIDGEPGERFNIFFDLAVQQLAVRRQGQNAESGPQTAYVGDLNNDLLVEPRGIEPRSEPCKGPVLPLNYGPVTDMTATVSPLVIPTSNSLSCR